MVADQAHIEDILRQVSDPEIPVLTIQDLGIYQRCEWQGSTLIVHIIPTYTGCPAMDMISVNIKAALQEAGINDVSVKLQLSPPWSTDMISEEGRRKMKEYGIAPPQGNAANPINTSIFCPQCESDNTEMVSHFGSTACKALYKCLDCKEPFDYFKCY